MAAKKTTKKAQKNSLVANINRRKRAGKSRPKARSTVAPAAYEAMQKGWPKKAKKNTAKKAKKSSARKSTAKKTKKSASKKAKSRR